MASKGRGVKTIYARDYEAELQVVDGVRVAPIKNGWAAFGDGWAVHAPTQEEALARYWQAILKHQEIAIRVTIVPEASMDVELAERLFHSSEDDDFGPDGLPPFSTDIKAAWQVVEHMAQDKTIHPSGFPNSTLWLHWWQNANLWADSAEDAAKRICIAALNILDGERPGV